ncbi:MAG: Trk system potassium transporter TrkA [Clostridia bacterium]|nr:Trk system potassium transporter TrkA [Clostridia bacterium]
MRIIVVGCGKIGTAILSSLVAEGHDVVAIDNIPSAITDISNIFDVICVCGNGADCEVLKEAEVEKSDLFVAVTGSDELNMLSCFIAKKMGAAHTIARIRNPEYNDASLGFMRHQLDLSMSINPDLLAAKELFNLLKLPGAVNIESFSGRSFEIAELKLKDGSSLDGLSLIDLRKKFKGSFLVCAVLRNGQVYIPDGNFVLKSGDKIGITAAQNELPKILKMMGFTGKKAENIMILGASRSAYYLSKLLINSGQSVKVIEIDRDKCLEFSDIVPEATVIMGDGAQQELLLEEGVTSTDAFVALTGTDEENILISIFVSSQNVPKVIAKVNREELSSMAQNLGLETIISPKKIISDILVRYARALQNSLGSNIETLYKIMDSTAEALEFSVSKDFKYVNIPLKEMKLKPDTLIAGIIRGRRSIIPSGDDVILAGDRVVIVAANARIQNLTDIIR